MIFDPRLNNLTVTVGHEVAIPQRQLSSLWFNFKKIWMSFGL